MVVKVLGTRCWVLGARCGADSKGLLCRRSGWLLRGGLCRGIGVLVRRLRLLRPGLRCGLRV